MARCFLASPKRQRRENASVFLLPFSPSDVRIVFIRLWKNALSFSVGFQFRVMRLALLAVMSLHSKRYDMIAFAIYNLAKPIITMRKHFITHNLPERAIIV